MNKTEVSLAITKEGDSWLLSPKFDGPIRIIGSSFDTKVKNEVHIKFLMFKLSPESEKGLMIVEDYKGRSEWDTHFITIDTRDEQPFNLKEYVFVPKGGKVLNIIDHHLEVACDDGKIFTSNPIVDPGKQYVDANLLCQFVYDLVPLQAIIGTTCDEKRENDALAEAAGLRKQLGEAGGKISNLLYNKERLEKKILTCLGVIEALEKKEAEKFLPSWKGSTSFLLQDFREKYNKI